MNTADEYQAWAKDPAKIGTLPFGLLEPTFRRKGAGACLVIRATVYFNNGYTAPTRKAIVQCYDRYIAALNPNTLTWYFTEGKSPVAMAKAPAFGSVIRSLAPSDELSYYFSSGTLNYEASTHQFGVMGLPDWEAKMGTRGMDVLTFSVPVSFIVAKPGVFQGLFKSAVADLNANNGYAGYAVNLSPLDSGENETGEYFLAHEFGPGVDIGEPLKTNLTEIVDKVKTADWLVALNSTMYRSVGGSRAALGLPPDWFDFTNYDTGGIIIQSGVWPQTRGEPNGKDDMPTPPPAYVLLHQAIAKVVAEESDILQSGTIRSTEPVLNTRIATSAWLKRFAVDEKALPSYWKSLHKTPKFSSK